MGRTIDICFARVVYRFSESGSCYHFCGLLEIIEFWLPLHLGVFIAGNTCLIQCDDRRPCSSFEA